MLARTQSLSQKRVSASALKQAAAAMEQAQQEKIAKAAKKLAKEEQQEQAVHLAAQKLLHDASKQGDNAKEREHKALEMAESEFDDAKDQAMQEAAKKISAAKEQEQAKIKQAKQQLGANNDKFLDMNAPENKDDKEKHDPFADLDPPVVNKAKKTQQLGANNDKYLDLNPPKHPEMYDPFSDMDPPIYKKGAPTQLKGTATAAQADAQVAMLQKELTMAKKKAQLAEKRMVQHLAASDDEKFEGEAGEDYKPTFYEDYHPGKLGPLAVSKRIPEDHAEGHKDCKLFDIDCDELWPWGKVKPSESGPPKRHSRLGDNMVGVFGQDDVVVPTHDSGLIAKAEPYEDRFDHWPQDSKKNKDLLYGNARKLISQKYLGVGDVYVPLTTLEKMQHEKQSKGQPLADFMFGSWQQGFQKPHERVIRKHVNMFDQPFRQHWEVANGNGHQVYKGPHHPNAYGGPVGLGPTLGDDPTFEAEEAEKEK
mmetsp:Transcript_4983/g.8005  ORF Transcript_4983/g.8005 Transcript_4983/m.8005 type:complete len:480 (+) Transcript_4983:95-1534(+)